MPNLKHGQILGGWLAPHPPHLVYAENPTQNEPRSRGGWEVLRWGYDHCRTKLKEQRPDVILVHTPHWQTTVGHDVLAVPKLSGLSVDPIFPHLFRYRFDLQVDVELALGISAEARKLGLTSKPMTNPDFRVDYGTITSLHMMNPNWDIPIIALSSNNSPYFHDTKVAQDEMIKLGIATKNAVIQSGKRVVLAASNSLSHLHFSAEPNPELPEDMSREHVFSQSQYEWDVRVLNLMRSGDVHGLMSIMPQFIDEACAEVKAGGLTWMLSAMDFPKTPAQVHAYGNVIGTGNAVVEWDLTSHKKGITP